MKDFIPKVLASLSGLLNRSPLNYLSSLLRTVWTVNAAIKFDKLFEFELAHGIGDPKLLFKLLGSHYRIEPVVINSITHDERQKKSLKQKIQQLSKGKSELLILLPGHIRADELLRVELVEILHRVDHVEHERLSMVKYLTLLVMANLDLFQHVSVAQKQSLDADQDSRGYVAEWVEPRWWLVD